MDGDCNIDDDDVAVDVDVDRSPTIALSDVIVILGDDDCDDDDVPPTPPPAPLGLRFFFVIDDCRDRIVYTGWVVIYLS
jgi:hypothetical protein